MKSFIALLLGLALAASKLTSLPLVDQSAKRFTLSQLQGSYVLLSFVYTRCPLPKMCPLTVQLNREVYAKWKADPKLPPLRFVLVTLDPKYDEPRVLARFAKDRQLDPAAFTLVTGTEEALSALASEFNVVGMPSRSGISHNLKSILLAPDLSELKQYKDNQWKPEEIIRELRRPLAARPPA